MAQKGTFLFWVDRPIFVRLIKPSRPCDIFVFSEIIVKKSHMACTSAVALAIPSLWLIGGNNYTPGDLKSRLKSFPQYLYLVPCKQGRTIYSVFRLKSDQAFSCGACEWRHMLSRLGPRRADCFRQ